MKITDKSIKIRQPKIADLKAGDVFQIPSVDTKYFIYGGISPIDGMAFATAMHNGAPITFEPAGICTKVNAELVIHS